MKKPCLWLSLCQNRRQKTELPSVEMLQSLFDSVQLQFVLKVAVICT